MDRRQEQYIKTARKQAKEYLNKKRGYKTRQEKKAFKIAEKLRIQNWKESLSALDSTERALRLRAFRAYRRAVNLKPRLIALAALLAAVLIIALYGVWIW